MPLRRRATKPRRSTFFLDQTIHCHRFVSSKFCPEFLNRIDENVILNSLSRESLRGIVKLEAKRPEGRLSDKSMNMIVSDEALDNLSDTTWSPKAARAILRMCWWSCAAVMVAPVVGGIETVARCLSGPDCGRGWAGDSKLNF